MSYAMEQGRTHSETGGDTTRGAVGSGAPDAVLPASLATVFQEQAPYVASIALRLLGRDAEVDDVVQDVFLRALKGLSQIRDAGALKGWLATVTVRVTRERLRIRRLKAFLGLDGGATDDVAAPGASPEDHALLSQIYAVLDSLPVDQRIAWTLRHIEGEQLEDVARLAGCSLATAKRRIAAANTVLERSMADG